PALLSSPPCCHRYRRPPPSLPAPRASDLVLRPGEDLAEVEALTVRAGGGQRLGPREDRAAGSHRPKASARAVIAPAALRVWPKKPRPKMRTWASRAKKLWTGRSRRHSSGIG